MTEKKEKAVRGVELKLVSELMKNSRRSDRELAKAVGVSEPTIGRLIKKLEKEGIIQEYTMIPDFAKLGYELMAITLAKMDAPPSAEIVKKTLEISWENEPLWPETIMIERVMGIGYNGIVVSVHKDYSALSRFRAFLEQSSYLGFASIDSVIVNLNDKIHYKSLTLSTVARDLSTQREKE